MGRVYALATPSILLFARGGTGGFIVLWGRASTVAHIIFRQKGIFDFSKSNTSARARLKLHGGCFTQNKKGANHGPPVKLFELYIVGLFDSRFASTPI